MGGFAQLPLPNLDALLFGAHRRYAGADEAPVDGVARDEGGLPGMTSCSSAPDRQEPFLSMLTDERLFEECGVRIAFTDKAGGVSTGPYASLNLAGHVGDDPDRVAVNRKRVLEALGCGDVPYVIVNQVHGTHIMRVAESSTVDNARSEARADADAIVVDAARVAAFIMVADCLPFAIVAPSGRFALVHAGWRGALSGIAEDAVRSLAHSPTGVVENPAGFNAYIGPHIRSECFEVGVDVAERFASRFGEAAVPAYRHVDLAQVVRTRLLAAGMTEERIADSNVCTVCDSERYYSYRATGGQCGRHGVIGVSLEAGRAVR